MAQPVTRTIPVTAVFTPLSAARCQFRGWISNPPTNVANVTYKDLEGREVAMIPGENYPFEDINLQDLQIKGTVDDIVTIVGVGV